MQMQMQTRVRLRIGAARAARLLLLVSLSLLCLLVERRLPLPDPSSSSLPSSLMPGVLFVAASVREGSVTKTDDSFVYLERFCFDDSGPCCPPHVANFRLRDSVASDANGIVVSARCRVTHVPCLPVLCLLLPFCFHPLSGGHVSFTLYEDSRTVGTGTQRLLFFTDNESGWHNVYKSNSMTCQEKVEAARQGGACKGCVTQISLLADPKYNHSLTYPVSHSRAYDTLRLR